MRQDPSPTPETSPDEPMTGAEGLTDASAVLARNIAALQQAERAEEQRATLSDRIAETMTAFTGSMTFAVIHLAIVAAWVIVNVGLLPGVKRFDPTFVILATAASVEAIFLSTFVLISQNRAAALAQRQASLDLQINLLTEHELTRLITLCRAMAARMGVEEAQDHTLAGLERHVAPEKVMARISAAQEDRAAGGGDQPRP